MGTEGKNRFDPSASWSFHEKCQHNRQILGQQEGFAEGAWFGSSHAQLLHQPCRIQSVAFAPRGARKGEILVVETSQGQAIR